MAKQQILALPQEEIPVDDEVYLVNAMSATDALIFMEKHLTNINDGKIDLSVIKQVVCKYVQKDNMQINEKNFDIMFARKVGHLQRVFEAVLKYNFDDVFTESDSED